MANLLTRIFGSANERGLKKLWPLVHRATALEPEYAQLADADFPRKTQEFKDRLTSEQDTLDSLLPEAFALCREAAKRTIGLRHYDVQLLGGAVLHQGKIAEMKTGEGKTLVATVPLYLNALTGKGAHLITVNDYLARRDVQWMGPIYDFLGLSVASIIHDTSYLFDTNHIPTDYRLLHLREVERQDAYRADITYGTNNEFGFDFLRDNMKFSLEEYVQRPLNFAIVDEVDNILIDEARTPLIISGPAEKSSQKYTEVNRIIPNLRREVDYTIDEKHRQVLLTDEGVAKCERLLRVGNLYDPSQIDTLHHVQQALRAHTLYKRDVDYVVRDGEVLIVDEFTGRLMPGRRWSDGLHQAVEAKEGARIENENVTMATVTIQNYFRMYNKLAGMTGTADTEAVEFKKIYNLDVVVMPPNKKNQRSDHADIVYKTEREKYDAVVKEIEECHAKGQPVLVGTTSVEKSEALSKLLKKAGVRHNVLNAINHEAEANIIAQAGRFEQVTIATNMAGRGTDILLGGTPEFLARAEMENEWMRGALAGSQAAGKAERYEDALRSLREKHDDATTRIRAQFGKELDALDQRRSEALKELTDADRELRALSPFAAARGRYEDSSSIDLLPALRDVHSVNDRYLRTREAIESALLTASADVRALADERAEFETARERFEEVLTLWESAPRRNEGLAREISERRSLYERHLASLEVQLLVEGAVTGDPALEEWRETHRTAEAAYIEAQRLFEAQQAPYDEALRAAEETYERERAEYVTAVEQIREELQKAPHEYDTRFKEIVEKYQAVCTEERDRVREAGGLHILGTERHEARRIDNQLRGRAGRQGDPGSSRFFLSLEDDLLRIFGADRMQGLMERLGMEEGVPIEHRFVTRAILNAQEKVEAHHFDVRKHLLEYDDVLNKQREVIYTRRKEYLTRSEIQEEVAEMATGLAEALVDANVDTEIAPSEWDWAAIDDAVAAQFNLRLDLSEAEREHISVIDLKNLLVDRVQAAYAAREAQYGAPIIRYLEKLMVLQTLDSLWRQHLIDMEHLKEGIGLRGYGQVNPLQAYQKEGYALFEDMIRRLESDSIEKLMTVQVQVEQNPAAPSPPQSQPQATPTTVTGPAPTANRTHVHAARPAAALPSDVPADLPPQLAELERQRRRAVPMQMSHGEQATGGGARQAATAPPEQPKVGRNDPCPCGSGKKYKKCHGTS